MYCYREEIVNGFYLLVLEKEPKLYRLYVSKDGEYYCHYDTGQFRNLEEALVSAKSGFDPAPLLLFPFTPYSKKEVIEKGPHAFDRLP